MMLSLLASLPEDTLCTVLAQLTLRDLASFLRADRVRNASDAFWRGLAQAMSIQLAPLQTRVALRSQANLWRTFLRALRTRRERFVQACNDIAFALYGRDAAAMLDQTLVSFPELQE